MIRLYLYIFLVLLFIGQVAAILPLWLQPDFVRQYRWSPLKTDLIEDCSEVSVLSLSLFFFLSKFCLIALFFMLPCTALKYSCLLVHSY